MKGYISGIIIKIALINEDKMNTNEEENNSGTTNTIQTLVYFSLGYLIGLSAVMFVGLATFFSIIFLKRIGRRIICTCTCNLSNQDYFSERYDTNIVDRNQYYEEEYEA